jgi:hypothetical protein
MNRFFLMRIICQIESLFFNYIIMKLWIKLSTLDKVWLLVWGLFVYTVWIIPSIIWGWILYTYRDKVKAFVRRRTIRAKINSFLSYFNK